MSAEDVSGRPASSPRRSLSSIRRLESSAASHSRDGSMSGRAERTRRQRACRGGYALRGKGRSRRLRSRGTSSAARGRPAGCGNTLRDTRANTAAPAEEFFAARDFVAQEVFAADARPPGYVGGDGAVEVVAGCEARRAPSAAHGVHADRCVFELGFAGDGVDDGN